jgi:ribosomal protein S18 acetylase RimI-like enzyme
VADKIILRDAEVGEKDELRKLTLAAYTPYSEVMEPSAWNGLRSAVESGLRTPEPADWIVAEVGGQLVGSVLLFHPSADAYGGSVPPPNGPELRLLAVDSSVRGRNIGRALVEECIRRARAMGAAEIGLHTSRSMKAAIRLYEQMGFTRVPERDFQPDGAELVTAYRLRVRDEEGNRHETATGMSHDPGDVRSPRKGSSHPRSNEPGADP